MPRETIPNEFTPRFIDALDQRTVAARTLRQRLAEIHSDMGGEDRLSYAQRSIARRVVWLESWLETQEARAAEGEEIDMGRQSQALNTLLGMFKTLGIERKAKDAPSLTDYLRQREARQG